MPKLTPMQAKLVRLKNGGEEFGPLVVTTMMALEELFRRNALAVYDLAIYCRDNNPSGPKSLFFANNQKECEKLSLINRDGRVHDSIRAIVLSAVEFEGKPPCDFRLVNPMVTGDPKKKIKQEVENG